jgi:hypothetical protein
VVDLILLNGPPASGKSTIAMEFVASRPLALNLDIDVVRGLLGGWLTQPTEAGLAARRLALAMARVHLAQGLDVIVPQLVARESFILELEKEARSCGARFVELVLTVDRDDALDRFAQRQASNVQTHRDAQALVERGGDVALGAMYDNLERLVASRPSAIRIDVVFDDLPETYRRVESALRR